MLSRQIDLHISIAVIIGSMAVGFLAIYRQHQVKFVWVKGHADIPENERCDQLAVQASKMPNLQIDYYYEAEQDNNLKLFI